MSIIGNKSAIRTPEFHKKKQRQRYFKIILWSLLFIAMVVLPIYLLRTQKFLIQNIRLQGNSVTKSEEIQKIVADDLAGNMLWFFPRSNIVIYPKKKIEADLLRIIPRLSSVDISVTDPHSLIISVAEREPVALYCKDVSKSSAPTGCYFLDDQGFIFSEAPSFSDGVYNVYASEPTINDPLGTTYLSPVAFAPLNPFIKSLGESGIYPKVFLKKDDEYDLVLANGGSIMLKSNSDLELVRSNLSALIQDPSFNKIKNPLDNLSYIDLRFGNKIFYKFRDGS